MQKNYRLLSPDEEVLVGDEYWDGGWKPLTFKWPAAHNVPDPVPYPVRRKIPPIPETKYTHVLLPVGSIGVPGDEILVDREWLTLYFNCTVRPGLTIRRAVSSGEVSDGYHTFNELYRHRCLLFCMTLIGAAESFKSSKHSDGSEWEGWFIAGAKLPGGWITYHLPNSMWLLCPAPEVSAAPEWDGHTPNDACDRMEQFLSLPISESENLPK